MTVIICFAQTFASVVLSEELKFKHFVWGRMPLEPPRHAFHIIFFCACRTNANKLPSHLLFIVYMKLTHNTMSRMNTAFVLFSISPSYPPNHTILLLSTRVRVMLEDGGGVLPVVACGDHCPRGEEGHVLQLYNY